ncbi:BatA domain-containing protein [Natronogracilivirga saccharolytica]|uniref:BatA domain-containing protein n=1 Tax=Natronogracilivirga saccharolytica TaxID=2812953 RepID=A0A8J7RR71_9BACT|nr:BatA domain-containing protein [Natronogracilivirga saccharolytica]MBP3191472.1 BatA domain-containing protein [Natronogracilivirga saccharolytica]
MSFLNPILFAALAAVAIPVIIHFINFRKPRKIAFSTLAFFQELQKSTIRRLNLKRYLLLALRVLGIAMLVTALARPFLPPQISGWLGASSGQQVIALLIDNGPSMMQIDEAGPYMDQAKTAAREVIEQSSDDARFLIVPSHGEVESGRIMRRAEALRYLEDLEPLNKGGYPAERMRLLQERLADQPGQSGHAYWISDARKTHLQKFKDNYNNDDPESEHSVTFIRVGDDSFQNISVASVELTDHVLGEGIPVGVAVTVKNFGDQPAYNSYLSLEIDGERMGQYDVDLEAGQEKELLFEVIPESPGTIGGKAILEGGTYTFDHKRYFSIDVPESRNVLLIGDEGEDRSRRSYLKPVLDAVSETGTRVKAETTDMRNIRDHELDNFDALILESPEQIPDYLQAELVQFVQQGRGLFFVPSEKGSMSEYNRFLSQFDAGSYSGMRGTYGRFEEVASFQPLSEGHILLDDVFQSDEDELRIDMPTIYHYLRYDRDAGTSGTSLLRSNLDEPLFVEHRFGDGMILVGTMGFSPGWSNLSIKPLYAPLVYRMILYAVAWEQGGVREHTLGRSFDRQFADIGTSVTMKLNGDEIRPETASGGQGLRVRYPAVEWSPGWLEMNLDEKKYVIAVNQDISESDFTSLSITETEEFLEESLSLAGVLDITGYSESEIRTAMADISFGREIWSLFIIIALAFMIAECIISKTYKTETGADKQA